MFINKVLKGDTIEKLKTLDNKSIDVIFADPPYFMQTEGILKRFDGSDFKGVDDHWDKFSSFEEYDKFTIAWLTECKRVLKDDGTIWVIGSYHNIFRIGFILQNLNFWILNDIVWSKTNPTPNFKGTKFVNSQETLIWATKSKNSKFTFNYKTMKSLNGGKQMKSIWEFPISSGMERLKNKEGKKLHNTQKPIKLLEYIILASTKVNDIILDPFFGTGTTGAAAKSLRRNWIGIEREKIYQEASIERIEKQKINKNFENEIIENILDIKQKNIPIQILISEGYINEKKLFNIEGNISVDLLKTGKTKLGEIELSIHRMAGKVQGLENYNGWTYWYIKKNKKMTSINEIREEYRNDKQR